MRFEFTKTRFLMCEGDDDKGFIETLIRRRGLPEFQVCHAAECNEKGRDGRGVGGRSGFKHSLEGFRPIKGWGEVKALLIATDHDTASSFKEVQDAFASNGYTPPESPAEVGAVDGKPAAVLMVPSLGLLGDLESLSLPEIHRVWPQAEKCVRDFLSCTGASTWTKQSSINKAQARSATVAFYEPEPYMGLGHLFRNGVLSVDNPCFDAIAEFLRNFDTLVGITGAGAAPPPIAQQTGFTI